MSNTLNTLLSTPISMIDHNIIGVDISLKTVAFYSKDETNEYHIHCFIKTIFTQQYMQAMENVSNVFKDAIVFYDGTDRAFKARSGYVRQLGLIHGLVLSKAQALYMIEPSELRIWLCIPSKASKDMAWETFLNIKKYRHYNDHWHRLSEHQRDAALLYEYGKEHPEIA